MLAYRIAPGKHPVFDATGASLWGGRWNSPGRRVIYGAETYSGAMLETLVHLSRPSPPPGFQFVRIEIPDSIPVERVAADALRGWNSLDMKASRAFGDRWYDERRSAVLLVPSVVTLGPERNVVINTEHPDYRSIKVDPPRPVQWDARLFR
ncbi:MAG: RES domain-containing protein [Acidobacteria bacterium]|nr:RES domain-containing protein [Acidobacteriota bacterium]